MKNGLLDESPTISLLEKILNDELIDVNNELEFKQCVETIDTYSLKEYTKAKDIYKTSLEMTSSVIKDEVYTLTEIRIIDGIIHCNRQIYGKFGNTDIFGSKIEFNLM